MRDQEKIPHLKIDRGRYFYQRRVPLRMQAHLGIRRWQIPCGDVGYSKAVQMVVTCAEEHDELIADLRNPDRLRDAGVAAEREDQAKRAVQPDPLDLPRFYEMTERLDGEKKFFPRHSLPRPWQAAAVMLTEAEADYAGKPSLEFPIMQINYRMEELKRGDIIDRRMSLPALPGLKEYVASLDPELVVAAKIEVRETVPSDETKMGRQHYRHLLPSLHFRKLPKRSIVCALDSCFRALWTRQGGAVICRHDRIIERSHSLPGRVICNWRHYLAVLQRKPGARHIGAPFVEILGPFRQLQDVMLRK